LESNGVAENALASDSRSWTPAKGKRFQSSAVERTAPSPGCGLSWFEAAKTIPSQPLPKEGT